jgi:hypothetical protein
LLPARPLPPLGAGGLRRGRGDRVRPGTVVLAEAVPLVEVDAQFTVPPDEVDPHFSDGRRPGEVRIRFTG